jgi:dienelactone hydrolase
MCGAPARPILARCDLQLRSCMGGVGPRKPQYVAGLEPLAERSRLRSVRCGVSDAVIRGLDEISDVKAALGWVAAHAAEHHVDPARISVMGNSAGANLTMLAAYSIGDPQLPPSTDVPPVAIHSVINFYGPTDLAMLHRNCKNPEYVHAAFKKYIGGAPYEFPDRYRVLSPLTHVSTKSSTAITFLGSSDRLVATDHAELLNQALTKAGVPHEMYFLPGNDHGFDVNWAALAPRSPAPKLRTFSSAINSNTQSKHGIQHEFPKGQSNESNDFFPRRQMRFGFDVACRRSGHCRRQTGTVTITLPDTGKRFMSMQVGSEDHYKTEVVYAPGRSTRGSGTRPRRIPSAPGGPAWHPECRRASLQTFTLIA